MFITPAYAQGIGGGGDLILNLLPFVLIFVIMYFLIIRPQQKRLKDHREMVKSLSPKDTVVTAGGLVGKVVKLLGDDMLLVELADGVRVKVLKGTISEKRVKGQPVKQDS